MQIMGWNKTTLLDYPGRVATTIFTNGCNFRCPFCHNGDLVLKTFTTPAVSNEDFFSFLEKRKGILTGVCITGGEPTIQHGLLDFIKAIKNIGYAVKLDTNGYQPHILSQLYQENLLDYVALDIKTSPSQYARLCDIQALDISIIKQSISLLCESGIPYEFRTTVVREFHDAEVMKAIGDWLEGPHPYYLQSFEDQESVLQTGLHSYTKEELEAFVSLLKPRIPNTTLRGVD